MIHLVLGGARSGKSSYAESLATASEKPVTYLATATPSDDEMAKRIKHHQQTRPSHWLLIEEAFDISQEVEKIAGDNSSCLLIECMTLWLSNWLLDKNLSDWKNQKQAFIRALKNSQTDIIIVSNEVGSGIVPMGELSREFVDQAGWLNQELARLADSVTLVVAACPLHLKSKAEIKS